eukprot:84189-Rhodomonas_salina.2
MGRYETAVHTIAYCLLPVLFKVLQSSYRCPTRSPILPYAIELCMYYQISDNSRRYCAMHALQDLQY